MSKKWTYIIQLVGIGIGLAGTVRAIDKWVVGSLAVGAVLWFVGWYARNKWKG